MSWVVWVLIMNRGRYHAGIRQLKVIYIAQAIDNVPRQVLLDRATLLTYKVLSEEECVPVSLVLSVRAKTLALPEYLRYASTLISRCDELWVYDKARHDPFVTQEVDIAKSWGVSVKNK